MRLANKTKNNLQELLECFYEAKNEENKIKKMKHFNLQVATLGRGETFGEEEIINGSTRKYTAVCYSNKVTLFSIQRNVSYCFKYIFFSSSFRLLIK
jgi:hypothetical protein